MKKTQPKPPPETAIQKTTLRVPTALWRLAKIAAIQQGMNLQDFLTEALRARVDLDSAVRMMKMTLQSYYKRRKDKGDGAEADGLRMQFGGAKFMLESVAGKEAKDETLRRLRALGLKIPHCGDRSPDGGYLGYDSDADLDY
jgi:hypothetical protein